MGLEEEERLLQKQNTHKKNQKIGSSQKPQNLFMEKENCTSERKEKKKRFSSFVKMTGKMAVKSLGKD